MCGGQDGLDVELSLEAGRAVDSRFAPFLRQGHAHHVGPARIHRDGDLVPQLFDVPERQEGHVSGKHCPAAEFWKNISDRSAVDHVCITSREIRLTAVVIFRFILEFQQVDHKDRAVRAFLQHLLHACRVRWEYFIPDFHGRVSSYVREA